MARSSPWPRHVWAQPGPGKVHPPAQDSGFLCVSAALETPRRAVAPVTSRSGSQRSLSPRTGHGGERLEQEGCSDPIHPRPSGIPSHCSSQKRCDALCGSLEELLSMKPPLSPWGRPQAAALAAATTITSAGPCRDRALPPHHDHRHFPSRWKASWCRRQTGLHGRLLSKAPCAGTANASGS